MMLATTMRAVGQSERAENVHQVRRDATLGVSVVGGTKCRQAWK